jgi:hypothetical protein
MRKTKLWLHTESLWVRAILGTMGSTFSFWIIYKLVLSVFSDHGKLSDFGAITIGLLLNLWTGAALNWVLTGEVIPSPIPSLSLSPEAPQRVKNLPIKERFIGSPVATLLLSITWLGVWFYVTILNDALREALFDSSQIGISLQKKDALKILTELSGILSLGITFPLLAASSFVVGWACVSSLRVSAMLIPATAFCVIAAVLNYGAEVLSTGRPPIYDIIQVVAAKFEGSPIVLDNMFLWIINIIVFIFGCCIFAGYGRMWTALGFWLRRSAVRNNA